MIDTIILTIPKENFVLTKESDASNWELNKKSGFFEKYVKNQTYQQKNDGTYRPRIRIIRRGNLESLQVEFSIPKLIFDNNIDEVCEKDFENILETLGRRLKDFGVHIYTEHIRRAGVSVFHPSKNIVLLDGYTASGVIKELNKINLTKKMDLNKDSFRNDGQSIQLYANSHSLVIYDKMQDLKKPKGRAIDKDKTCYQLSLFQQFEELERRPEILRIEARLANKRKMNEVLVKNGFEKNPTFEGIFKESVCQKVVLAYWNELVIKDNLFLFSFSNNPKQVLNKLIQNYPTMKPKEAIYLVGLDLLCRDEQGIRELRGKLEKQAKTRTWYRVANDMKKLNGIQNSTHCHSWISQVERQINNFKPLKANDLLCKEK